jgi:hypothetical protein
MWTKAVDAARGWYSNLRSLGLFALWVVWGSADFPDNLASDSVLD